MVATMGILACSASEALTPKPSQRELHRRWLSAHTYQATCTSPLKVLCIMGPLHICRHDIPHHHPGAAQYTSCTLWPIQHRLHLWHSTAGIKDPSAEIFSVSLLPGYPKPLEQVQLPASKGKMFAQMQRNNGGTGSRMSTKIIY